MPQLTLPAVKSEMDLETVKFIAEATAKATATEMSAAIRKEISEQLQRDTEKMEQRFAQQLQTYFGEQSPSKHAEQHARIDRILNFWDRFSQNLIGKLLMNALILTLIATAAGYYLWTKLKFFGN